MYNQWHSLLPTLVISETMNSSDTRHSIGADDSVQTIWKQACIHLQQSLSPAVYNTWIMSNPLTQFSVTNDLEAEATITSPTAFHAANIKKNLQSEIQQALFKVTGKTTNLQFIVGTPTPSKKKSSFSRVSSRDSQQKNEYRYNPPPSEKKSVSFSNVDKQTSPRAEDLFSPETIRSSTISQAAFLAKKAGLRTDYKFNTFAVSTTNEMAHAAATAVSKNPGKAYNPLFFYGGVGVGKTHLMHAIGNNIIFNDPQAKVIYCTGEEFTNEIVSSIQTKKTLQFKNKYRNTDVFLIDDVQFLAGKNAVQEEFFHTFNAIIKSQGQIVLTSDKPPHEITLLEDRLRSRFEAGLMIDIQQPTFELRTAILLIKARAHSLPIPMEIAQMIASKVDSARRIEGIIISLRSEVELKKKEITKDLVESLLESSQTLKKQEKLRVSPIDVIKTVSDHFHIKQSSIKGKRRQKEIVKARHVAMFILKKDLDLPYVEIGRWFSNRDHTSVMHAHEKIEKLLIQDETLHRDLSAIKTSLQAISK